MATDELSHVLTSVDKAKGLPNEHYISAQTFEEEKHAVLFKNWSGVGFGKDIPEPRDAKPITFLGMPLLLVRDTENIVRVFQNTCRHRGMILVDEPRKLKGPIRCPYHSWCYGLDGKLASTPHVGGPDVNSHENINYENLGLFEIRSHVWQDVIFINIDGTAPDFEEAHSDLLTRWKEFDQEIYHGGASSSFQIEVATNWKLAVENFCESYHLPWIHPALNVYSKLEDHYHIETSLEFSGQGTLVYQQLEKNGQKLPDFKGLSDKWDHGAEYVSFYPNVLMGVHRDHVYAIVIDPIAPGKSIEYVELYYTKEAISDKFTALRKENDQLWKTVFEEDIGVVEGMQRGRQGVYFDGGKFSPAMDSPTHNFHHWVASHVSQSRNTPLK